VKVEVGKEYETSNKYYRCVITHIGEKYIIGKYTKGPAGCQLNEFVITIADLRRLWHLVPKKYYVNIYKDRNGKLLPGNRIIDSLEEAQKSGILPNIDREGTWYVETIEFSLKTDEGE